MMQETGSGKYEQLLERCRGLEPIPAAVAWPCDESSLAGAIDAGRDGLIVPILVGAAAKISEVAKAKGIALRETEVVDAPTSRAAAAKAVELVRTGRAELLMKGSLHSDEILGAVVARETGLRTGRRCPHGRGSSAASPPCCPPRDPARAGCRDRRPRRKRCPSSSPPRG